MHAITGAILILAASVLISAGVIADSVNHGSAPSGAFGYILGGIVGCMGLFTFARGWLKDMADAAGELIEISRKNRMLPPDE